MLFEHVYSGHANESELTEARPFTIPKKLRKLTAKSPNTRLTIMALEPRDAIVSK